MNRIAGLCISLLTLMGMVSGQDRVVKPFDLLNVDGKMSGMSAFPKAKGFIVVFNCNHCPFAKLYPARLVQLSKHYAPLDVPLLVVSSTDTVAYEEDGYNYMVAYAKANNYGFPYLYDAEQSVAKSFRAQRTPHAFVIWKQEAGWTVRYNGAIDDNGQHPELVKKTYLADAVDKLLSGNAPEPTETKSIGCQIHFRK